MPEKPITLFEHQELFKRSDKNENSSDPTLSATEFDELRKCILDYPDIDGNDKAPLRVYSDRLKALNYVGAIMTSGGTPIEILPKIHLSSGAKGEDEIRETKDVFIKMILVYLGKHHRKFDQGIWGNSNLPLLEVFILLFLEAVSQIIQRGLARAYVSYADNLYCLKGKIDFTNHLRYNLAHKERFYVQYDEFSMDRPINRIIKKALKYVHRISKDNDNYRLASQLIPHFDEVGDTNDWKHEDKTSNIDRGVKNRYYEDALDWARLILQHLSPDNWSGEKKTISLLFPMERVFEYYVTHVLQQHLTSSGHGFSFKSQSTKHQVMIQKQDEGNVSFTIQPDMVAQKHNQCLIMDTKWKRINQKAGSNKEKYGISQADIYQLYSYGKVYKREFTKKEESKYTELFLLYPGNDNFEEIITLSEDGTDEGNDKNLILKVIPVDLPDLKDTKIKIDEICKKRNLANTKSA